MNIKDILQRDPAGKLVNQGQARIADRPDENVLRELRGELENFVCEGQFADGMQKILASYLANVGHTSQKATWVSGFYGSGKSHLLKMLCHLWQDTPFSDGATARTLVPALPDDVRSALRELDTAGKRGGGLLAAAGSLHSGTTDQVRATVLGVLLRSVNLPEQHSQARFCLRLMEEGQYDNIKRAVEATGKSWERELNNLYVSAPIRRALLDCGSDFGSTEADVKQTLQQQFVQPATDITTAQFLEIFRQVLKLQGKDGRLPSTIIVLDEVQQYIGTSNERSVLITEVAEAICKQLDSKVMLVAAGQSALTDVPLLHRLMDRFTIRVPLSDTDVETVTRKVLLQKKPATVADVRRALETHAGEISRELLGTAVGERASDRDIIIDDYPLLPARRRFWEHVFRQVDLAGTRSQLRSQLSIIHDALGRIADRPLGVVIPGDELYDALVNDMLNTGVLLRDIYERIAGLGNGRDHLLGRRICGLVFLIGKLDRNPGADIGVRATKEHIADLLIDNLGADNNKLRGEVETTLTRLADQGVLMRVGEEYRIQTREGAEWDNEFRNRQTKLANDPTDLQIKREQLLYSEFGKVVGSLRLLQGAAKQARQLSLHREDTPPTVTGQAIPVWVRDGWSGRESDVLDAARRVSPSDPEGAIIYVFIPKRSPEDLRKYIAEADAAQSTLDYKGVPNTPEGQEARHSTESRRDLAVHKRDELLREIVAGARVFQGGGSELPQPALEDRLREAANDSLVRLFPRFNEADASAQSWKNAIDRSRAGSDQPFQAVGYQGNIEQHPVCAQVLSTIGGGKSGTEVRKVLEASPFGWPRDAVDAALIALHRFQHVTATLNGVPVAPGQLDQNRVPKAEFRVESATISIQDKLQVRKLFQLVKIDCKPGEEQLKAPLFLAAVTALADAAGGMPPMPQRPSTVEIEDVARLAGNEQLVAIRDKASKFEAWIKDWSAAKELALQRMPAWSILDRMARHAAAIPTAAESIRQVEAVRNERMLLAKTDPLAPLKAALAKLLRDSVNQAQAEHEAAYKVAMATLAANDGWKSILDQDRQRILAEVQLSPPVKPDTSTDEKLLASLDAHSLAARRADADAVSSRAQRALELAARLLEPKVKIVVLERVTLRTPEDVGRWLGRQEKVLVEAVKNGPVLIQ